MLNTVYSSNEVTGQCGPEFASMIPPSKPSSFSLLFFVSSSVIFRIYLFPFALARREISFLSLTKILSPTRAEVQHDLQENFILKCYRIACVKYAALLQLLKILLTYRLFMLDFRKSLSLKLCWPR